MIVVSDPENISRAAALLAAGEVLAIPTETVYGLAANAFDESAVAKIFKIKGRPNNNPLIVHLCKFEQIAEVSTAFDSEKMRLQLEKLSQFWPGPLSVVIPKRSTIPDNVSAGLATVAVRIPGHSVALKLLQSCALPLAAPSANRSGYISPTSAQQVEDEIGDAVKLIIDGGACQVGIESTVLSLVTEQPTLLRPGAITIEQLSEVLDEQVAVYKQAKDSSVASPSPGLSYLHYAPITPLKFTEQIDFDKLPERSGLISFKPTQAELPTSISEQRCLSKSGNLDEVARRLFATLRELDQMQLNLIIIDNCPSDGLGKAIMDRLERATQRYQ